MATARRNGGGSLAAGLSAPRERQQSLLTWFDAPVRSIARAAEDQGPGRAAAGLFLVVLALLSLGFLLQVSHASTTLPEDAFHEEVRALARMRGAGLGLMLGAYLFGPSRLARFVPALTVLALGLLLLVYVPGLRDAINGSRRWVRLPGVPFTVQPSEVARVIAVLWVARRCTQLGDRIHDGLRGYLPMLLVGLLFAGLILCEPDLGGTLLFLIAYATTMWIGGARPAHLASSVGVALAAALVGATTALAYVRERFAVWLGDSSNDQVSRSAHAMASGDLFGVGLGHGQFRNQSLQYMQTDYALSLVGEELGLFGILVVIGLWVAFLWFGLRLVLSVRQRFAALAAFGLLVSVAFQAMLHLQVVTGLAPPKGMTLPFLSDGGSALLSACLAVGLALGASRAPVDGPSVS